MKNSKNPSAVAFQDIQKYFLIVITILLIVLFFQFLSPFFSTLIIAGVIAAGTHPFNQWLTKKVKNRTVATLLTLLIVTVIILAPFTMFFFFIAQEATTAYTAISDDVAWFLNLDIALVPAKIRESFLGEWFTKVTQYTPISYENIFGVIQDALERVSSFLVAQTAGIVARLSLFILYILVFLLSLFYFLRDGAALIKNVKQLIPLPTKYRDTLFNKLNQLSKGVIYGFFGAAVAQGLLAGFGFYVVGISNAAFWGTIMAFFSPIPYLGTSLIWVPAVIILLIQKHFVAGIFLFAWCAALVGTADNIVKPYLIGKSTAIHPLAILLMLLGGVFTFGLKGLILGPFILTLLLAFLHIYQLEYKKVLKK